VSTVDVLQVGMIVPDAEALDRVTPAALARYLAARGWVMFPPSPGFGDHRTRISDVLEVLASVEERTQLAVLVDLLELAARESEVAGG
jgi:hypothetical protein